jgi:predicted extracellular nuclease
MFSISGINNYHRCGEKIIGLKARVISTSSLSMEGGQWSGNTRADLEAGIPDLGDYRLLVCGFNVENYFMTWGSMGAYSYAEHQAQRAKVHKALKKINADIYGLVELQKGDDAIREIVNDLNKALPKRHYKYFSGDASSKDQKVDFVYDENTVEPIGIPAETSVELPYRKKMICFREKETGEKFIYSINHFKAMNTGGADRRENESKAVVKLYNSYRQNRSIMENDLLLMGDLNCYAKTEPIMVFTESNNMIDLHRAFHADSSYSYMFGGLTSYIDHAISNETLYRQVTGMAGYHINSDEDDKYTYDKSSDKTMFRCSDHDPVLVGLKLDSTLSQPLTPYLNTWEVLEHTSDKIVIQNAYSNDSEKKSFYAIYTINGLLQERKEITSDYHIVDLPNEPGVYIIYLYFKGEEYQKKLIVR